jgi:hypothetical protein
MLNQVTSLVDIEGIGEIIGEVIEGYESLFSEFIDN